MRGNRDVAQEAVCVEVAMHAVAWLKRFEPQWAAAQTATEAAGRHDSMEAAAQALVPESYTRTAPPRPRKLGRRR
ncbi:hypothetical protein [Candidatus Poriferisodalis sp.]|uniref:hypothetical protein n=1 Tax=Candidatus Poriferisodalis sp. TaxID=3101277 RepID=UPI003B5AAE79